jgi:DNA-directed RNA polymerase omega subunit
MKVLRERQASRFELVILTALRSKQLQRGSHPRIEADPLRRKSTSIALEEVRQGLVPFTAPYVAQEDNGDESGGA